MTENELFAAFQAAEGDKKDLLKEELAKALLKHALSVCWLQLKEYSPEVANWCVHKAFQKMNHFRGDALFTTWFHSIVINACTSNLRDKLKRNETSLEDVHEHITACYDTGMVAKAEVAQIIEQLDEDDREFVWMRANGMDDVAIAKATGMTRTGVRSKWFRIRKRILKKLSM
jgi:RNA polymerase sigma factor (sigma-70 family)